MTPQKDITIDIKRLSSDTEYFTNVFKRVEKVISVIFYILSFKEQEEIDQEHVRFIKDSAFATHVESLATLRVSKDDSARVLHDFAHTLLELESTLRVAEAAGIVPANITTLIFEQLDLVQRFIKESAKVPAAPQLAVDIEAMFADTTRGIKSSTPKTLPTPRKKPVRIPSGDISSDAYFVYSQLTDRAERIKTVLEAKPQATIKDIAEIITDVSEKTIQRELNSLIEKGQVLREGERRWSRYSVIK